MTRKTKKPPPPAAPVISGNEPALRGLLEACKAEPEDDAPRLILADWLEEHGGESERARAELIRLQLDRSRREADGQPFRQGGPVAERRLTERYLSQWLGPVDRIRMKGYDPLSRGLFTFPALGRTLASRRHEALASAAELAWVEGIRLFCLKPSQMEKILSSPFLSGVTHLGLSHEVAEEGCMAQVAKWPGLARLHTLHLTSGYLGRSRIAELLVSPYLGGLRDLRLEQNQLTPELTEALAATAGLAGLRSLDIPLNGVGLEGAVALARSPHLGRLRRLNLCATGLPAEAVVVLARSDRLRGLEVLTLSENTEIGAAEAMEALAQSEPFSRLTALHLENVRLRSAGMRALAKARHLGRLTRLDLARNDFDLGPLVGSPLFAGLRALSLRGCYLGSEGAGLLAASGARPALRFLDLTSCGLGPEGAKALASWPGLAGVEALNLSYNDIREAGMRALAESPYLSNLRRLDLHANALFGKGVVALTRAGWRGQLEYLDLSFNYLGKQSIEALLRAGALDSLGQLALYDRHDTFRGSHEDATRWRASLQDRFADRLTTN